jgi:thimet oligopeptidase
VSCAAFFFVYTKFSSLHTIATNYVFGDSVMNYNGIAAGLVIAGLAVTLGCAKSGDSYMMSEKIHSVQDVKALFPTSTDQIKSEADRLIAQAQKEIDAIIAIPDDKRTFQNSAKALDDIVVRGDLAVFEGAISIIKYLHPDAAMRDTAHDMIKKIDDFQVEQVSNNKKLYNAFKAYANGNAQKEQLNDEQRYYIDETMREYKRAGLDLDDATLAQVKEIKKKLTDLSMAFDRNIAQDNRTITVKKADLAGLDESFINALKKDDAGDYILGADYPTYFQVMQHCTIESTRKKMYELFEKRAYPVNEPVLQEIIALRDQLAHLIGYPSYAALNISNQMAATPERAGEFLASLRDRAQQKNSQELDAFIKELPASVSLTSDGKVKAWDLAYLKTKYKEKKFNVDERKISEYFPMQQTIDALLDIYRQFLSIDFKEVPVSGLWHEDVRLIEVYNKDQSQLYGYLFLDLYPRPNKYSHAAHLGIVPAIKLSDGSRLPAVSVVMANFPKATQDKPALLMRSDVSTFFHEFGHALHAQLGATQLGSFAGTHVKTDFVEMPSQMLEEWLWDPAILKKVSSHYQTGHPLPDEMIANVLKLKNYDSGSFVVRQAMLAQYSLDIYKAGASKDPQALWFDLAARLMPRIYWGPEYQFYASFGHLTGYGSKYYGYLWSKVFALDLFNEIKKVGLLNPVAGTKYVTEVIGKGGSVNPNMLLKNFLGREPQQDAFFKDMGLE